MDLDPPNGSAKSVEDVANADRPLVLSVLAGLLDMAATTAAALEPAIYELGVLQDAVSCNEGINRASMRLMVLIEASCPKEGVACRAPGPGRQSSDPEATCFSTARIWLRNHPMFAGCWCDFDQGRDDAE